MVSVFDYEDVVGEIYQSLTSEEPWRAAIEKIRVLLAASNMMLRISHKGGKQRDSMFAYGPKVLQEGLKDWEDHRYRKVFPVSPTMGDVMFFRWEDVLPPCEALEQMRINDASWTIVHCFDVIDKADCQLIGSRGREQLSFEAEDALLLKRLGGHFRRAVRLRRELLRTRLTSEFQAEGLDRMSIGGILVDQAGQMMLLNDAARDFVTSEDGVKFSAGRIHAVSELEDRRLQAAIGDVLLSRDSERPLKRAIALTRKSGKRPLGLVISGRRSISLISGKPEFNALIFIRDSESPVDLDVSLMQQLFGFTRSEATIAVGLAKGMCLKDLESDLKIRHNTARAHLRSMFLKADVNRQSELVHLLANSVASLGTSRAEYEVGCSGNESLRSDLQVFAKS